MRKRDITERAAMTIRSTVREGFSSVPPPPTPMLDGVPVVMGEPVEPYELPDDPVGNEQQLRQVAEDRARRRSSEGTMLRRGTEAVAEGMRKRKGTVYERTFFNRWTVEGRSNDGQRSFEITFVDPKHMRGERWSLVVGLWRAK